MCTYVLHISLVFPAKPPKFPSKSPSLISFAHRRDSPTVARPSAFQLARQGNHGGRGVIQWHDRLCRRWILLRCSRPQRFLRCKLEMEKKTGYLPGGSSNPRALDRPLDLPNHVLRPSIAHDPRCRLLLQRSGSTKVGAAAHPPVHGSRWCRRVPMVLLGIQPGVFQGNRRQRLHRRPVPVWSDEDAWTAKRFRKPPRHSLLSLPGNVCLHHVSGPRLAHRRFILSPPFSPVSPPPPLTRNVSEQQKKSSFGYRRRSRPRPHSSSHHLRFPLCNHRLLSDSILDLEPCASCHVPSPSSSYKALANVTKRTAGCSNSALLISQAEVPSTYAVGSQAWPTPSCSAGELATLQPTVFHTDPIV